MIGDALPLLKLCVPAHIISIRTHFRPSHVLSAGRAMSLVLYYQHSLSERRWSTSYVWFYGLDISFFGPFSDPDLTDLVTYKRL